MTTAPRPKTPSLTSERAEKLLIALMLSVCVCAPSYGAIFRTVDADGNVTFTDQAPKTSDSDSRVVAEEIEVNNPNTFADEAPYQRWEGTVGDASDSAEEGAPSYSLSIVSPGNDQTIRENSGSVVVRTRVDPGLVAGDKMRLELDGTLTGDSAQSGAFNLTNVPRGTHRARVVIENEKGRRVAESGESVFHLQRISLLSPNSAARRANAN